MTTGGSIWHHHLRHHHWPNSQHASVRASYASSPTYVAVPDLPHLPNHFKIPLLPTVLALQPRNGVQPLSTSHPRHSLHDKNYTAEPKAYQLSLPSAIMIPYMHSTATTQTYTSDSYTAMQIRIPHYKPDLYTSWEPDWTRIGPPWPPTGPFCPPCIPTTNTKPTQVLFLLPIW